MKQIRTLVFGLAVVAGSLVSLSDAQAWVAARGGWGGGVAVGGFHPPVYGGYHPPYYGGLSPALRGRLLRLRRRGRRGGGHGRGCGHRQQRAACVRGGAAGAGVRATAQIGRASCRERVYHTV